MRIGLSTSATAEGGGVHFGSSEGLFAGEWGMGNGPIMEREFPPPATRVCVHAPSLEKGYLRPICCAPSAGEVGRLRKGDAKNVLHLALSDMLDACLNRSLACRPLFLSRPQTTLSLLETTLRTNKSSTSTSRKCRARQSRQGRVWEAGLLESGLLTPQLHTAG